LCMLGLASYTANLSSFLLMQNLETGIKDFNDAMNKNVKICVVQAMEDMLISSYPKVQPLLVPQSAGDKSVAAFHEGKCDAVLTSPWFLDEAYAAEPPYDKHGLQGHCNLQQVGEPILAIPLAIPISRDLDHALSYVWSRSKYSGKMEQLKKQYPAPSSKCSNQGGLKEGATPMDVGDMLGGLLAVLLVLVFSFIMHILHVGRVRFATHIVTGELPVSERESVERRLSSVTARNSMNVLRVASQNPKVMTAALVIFLTLFILISGIITLVILSNG